MSVRTREEILVQINDIVGENNDDNVIALIEDVTDTINDYENRINGDGVDWKTRYEENDRNWREKYVSRFNEDVGDNGGENNKANDVKKYSYDELFTEKE